MIARRRLLKTLALGGAAAVVPGGAIASVLHSMSPGNPQGFRFQNLQSLLGAEFTIADTDGIARTARLVEVDPGPDSPGLEQFSIVLEGSKLPEGIFDIYHPGAGHAPIALMYSETPGAGLARRRAYFSRFV
jgi:hypothetical protein